MDFKELVKKARSYRRFDESRPVGLGTLVDVVDTVRYVPVSVNRQALRFAVCADPALNATLSGMMGWAGLLKEWGGPKEGERPTGFIVIGCVGEDNKMTRADMGIAAQTMQLALAAEGLGCCMIGNTKMDEVGKLVGMPEGVTTLIVLAVGYPKETIVLDEVDANAPTAYWRDEQDHHHVPKRTLDVVLVSRRG